MQKMQTNNPLLQTKLVEIGVTYDDFKRTISVPNARQTVSDYYKAEKRTVHVTQDLYPKEYEKPLRKARTKIKNFFNASNKKVIQIDGKWVVLATEAGPALQELTNRVEEYKKAVRTFVSNWSRVMVSAQADRGDMFSHDDYPDPASILEAAEGMSPMLKELSFKAAKINVLSDGQVEKFEKALQDKVSSDLVSTLVSRVFNLVKSLEGKRFDPVHYQSIKAVLDVIESPDLPQTSKVKDLAKSIKDFLAKMPKGLKDQPTVREEKAKELRQLVAQMM